MGDSRPAADSACNVVPGTALRAAPTLTGAGDCDESTPMVTNTTRMSTARPSTIMAGRMEIPPGVGGRSGSGGVASSVRNPVSVSCSVMTRPAYGASGPPEMVEGSVPGPQAPPGAPGQRRGDEGLGLR